MNSQYLKKIKLPNSPGIYIFKKDRRILYIGKATLLKDRVRSYFANDLITTRGPVIVDMVFKANKIDFIKTDSVLEALILESNLIKKYQPKYNTIDKDDRSYNYAVITKEDFPRVLVIRGKESFGGKRFNLEEPKLSKIFGPFVNGTQLKEALKIIRKIFPFIDNYSEKKTGYKFYREIGLAPEVGSAEAKKDYEKTIRNIKLFFEGKKTSIIKNLKGEMKGLAKNQEFEKADKAKRTIFALNHIQDIALLKDESKKFDIENGFRIEAYDVAHTSGTNTVGVMTVIENRKINKNEYRKFKINNSIRNDIAALEEILERRLKHTEWKFPDIIVVDGGIAQKNIAEKIIRKSGLKIDVIAVIKNEAHKPKNIQGKSDILDKYKNEIILANSEAHRFAISYHRNIRDKF